MCPVHIVYIYTYYAKRVKSESAVLTCVSRAGNQAASTMGGSPQFYNGISHAHGLKARVGQKNLVGSYKVQRKGKVVPLSSFIGDQMKNSAKKSPSQKLMVGSFQVQFREVVVYMSVTVS